MTETRAFVGGTLIDGTGRRSVPDPVVVVAEGRILNVFRKGEIEIPETWEVVDTSGKYILPGLIECHTHIAGLNDDLYVKVDDQPGLVDIWMRAYIRNGVTTVRDTGNSDPDQAMAFCREEHEGWPRFFGAGPVLDGKADPPTPWRWLWVMDDEKTARETVARLVDGGVDFLKIYVWLQPEIMRVITDEAHRRGVKVTGHVGNVVTVEDSVKLGVDSLEHVRMGPELLGPDLRDRWNARTKRALDPIADYRAWRYAEPDLESAERLIKLLLERGVFWTPTLTWSQSILKGDVPEVVAPAGMDVVPEDVQEQWKNYVYYFDYTKDDFVQAKTEMAKQMEFVGRAAREGVKVTAGTDASNPWVVPGFSLHEELVLLVQSGLSPMDAISASTGRAAALLGKDDEIGTVQKRRRADLLILNSDPLADIRHTQDIWSVLKDGEFVSGERSGSA